MVYGWRNVALPDARVALSFRAQEPRRWPEGRQRLAAACEQTQSRRRTDLRACASTNAGLETGCRTQLLVARSTTNAGDSEANAMRALAPATPLASSAELEPIARATRHINTALSSQTVVEMATANGASRELVAELVGLEPTTSCMPWLIWADRRDIEGSH
jgi:hypothetical protein